jgi:cellulose synthase/poly-beta-1,6-N-acetylglucosamine synthase-like glycosyltransferase
VRSGVIEILLGALALALLVPASVLLLQVLAALTAPRGLQAPQGKRLRLAVLVPAHNEASVIGATLRSVLPQLAAGDCLLVVADNCSDETAAIAARAGATLAERHDAERPGKNHALEFGIRRLADDPPEVLIIVDADCQVGEGAIDTLARACHALARPVQSLYLMLPPPGAGLTAQVASFAWIVKNWVRPLGMNRLGLPCQLMGSGTAFPWRAIAGFRIANSEMAEDYKFGIDLALAGYPAVFWPAGTFISYFPATREIAEIQRTRWEHGHLQLILRAVPRLLLHALSRRDLQLFGLAIDLLVCPLAFLALLLAATGVLSLAFSLSAGIHWPLLAVAMALGAFAAAIALAWCGWGRKALPAASMLSIPGYLLWKIPIYLRFLTNRQKVWIKTRRD